jgi:DNA-binding transcriptional LysR family regulator
VEEARRAGGLGSAVRIGCSLQFPLELMRVLLEALQERVPAVQVEVTHLRGLEQVSRLRHDALDLGLFHYAQDHEEIETEPLFAGEPLAAFLPLGHRLSENDVLDPGAVGEQVLVTFPRALNPALHDWFVGQLEDAGYRFAGVREATGADPRDAMLAVSHGRGIVVAPTRFAEAAHAGDLVERRPLGVPLSMPDMVAAWRASPPAHVREALDALREAARSLGRGALADSAGDVP